MRFKLYREYGALNSGPVFDAFSSGIKNLGHEEVSTGEDVAVIWSVLWKGRMSRNKEIYEAMISKGKSIIIIEVGNLKRGTTWRISKGNINGEGFFANHSDFDPDRPQKLRVSLNPLQNNRNPDILVCGQLQESLQWRGMPPMNLWFNQTIDKIKSLTDRKIVLRPHPRSNLVLKIPDIRIEIPRKILGTYDDFDINYNYHCVINHNSGPAVQAALFGTPIICDSSSLAYPVGEKWKNIENPKLPDRIEWFLKLCHTEWTLQEIADGIPLSRLLSKNK